MTLPQVQGAEDTIRELEAHATRYPAERYPVQHATVLFHLGVALTNSGRLEEAEGALRRSARLFDPERLGAEHAKALNALGAVLRSSERLDEAASCFRRAAELFAMRGARSEQGAALFNLGLVERELGLLRNAIAALEGACDLLDPAAVPAQAAAANRELGSTLFSSGEMSRATGILEKAVAQSKGAGDRASLGAASNALGLVHLACGRLDVAVEAFRSASGANPRNIRPEGFAMAKANLALAYERAGDRPRAVLAATQALSIPRAPEPVVAQAQGIAARLGRRGGEILEVLEDEPRDRWDATLREELARLAEAGPEERHAELAAWIRGSTAPPRAGADLAEAWLGALLELPSNAMDLLIQAALAALEDQEEDSTELWRGHLSSGMARFHVPQLMRIKEAFERLDPGRGR